VANKSLTINSEEVELKARISTLQEQIAELTEKRDALKKQILQFDLRYNARVGFMVQEILKLRMEKARRSAAQDQTQNAWYEETKHDYQEYTQKQNDISKKKYRSLNDEDLALIKSTFRRAAKKCHPDTAPEDKRDQYQTIFVELREAYEVNDLERVLDIHEKLEQDNLDAMNLDSLSDLELLRKKLRLLESKHRDLEYEIAEIIASETYETIQTNKDLDQYFSRLERELNEQLIKLQNEQKQRQ
jgi:hypothetical protein